MFLNKVEICGVNTSELPLLSNEEKENLFLRIERGDKAAREKYVKGNLRLVLSVIQRFSNNHEHADDLFQVGCIGLMKAVDNFDRSLDVKFSTYAVPMILGEVRRYLRDNNSIRVSRSLRDTAYKAIYAKEQLTKSMNRTPTIEEIAKETGISPEIEITEIAKMPEVLNITFNQEDEKIKQEIIELTKDATSKMEDMKKFEGIKMAEDINKRITHVVLMGIGEPFDNYDNVLRFVKIINCGKGIDIGSRHITISTCGVIPGIKKFMNEEGQVNLAISLHAPNDTLRSRIMPINKAYPLNELMETIKEYINKTNRRVTFEYIMLDNVNDSEENAKELALLLKGINCYVNLIPYNETENIEFKRTKEWKIMKFYDILKKNKINVTIRKEFGGSVDAACGQLRANN